MDNRKNQNASNTSSNLKKNEGFSRCDIFKLASFHRRLGDDCYPLAGGPEFSYHWRFVSTVELRREIKKAVDRLSPERLASLADYDQFLTHPALEQRLAATERAIASGKGINWRKVRSDV